MSQIHAAHDHAPVPGRCSWSHHAYGVELYCGDAVIPGLLLCSDHFIAWAHGRADAGIPPATPVAVAAENARLGVTRA